VAVPNSPRASIGKPRTYAVPPGSVAAGVGSHGSRRGKVVYLACEKGKVVVRSPARWTRHASTEITCPAPVGESGDLWPLAVFGGELRAVFVAGDRSLWRVDFENQSSKLLAEGVHAVTLRSQPSALVAVDRVRDGEPSPGPAVVEVTAFRTRVVHGVEQPWQRALLRASRASSGHWMVGYEAALKPGLWQLVYFRQIPPPGAPPVTRTSLRAPDGCHVVGVDATGDYSVELGLYLLDARRTELFVATRHRSRTLVRTTSPIDRVTVATGAGLAAYTTTGGELGFVERSGRLRWSGRFQ
jgi:hypothetical protein